MTKLHLIPLMLITISLSKSKSRISFGI